MSQQPRSPRVQERPRRTVAQQQRPGATGTRPRARVAAARRKQQQRNMLLLVGGTLIVLVVIIVAAVLHSNNSSSNTGLADPTQLNNVPQKPLAVGTKAPNFTLSTVDGKSYSLSSFKGRPVLLEFFAVWCPHCQRMAPVLESLNKQYGPSGLQTLSVLANPYGPNYDTSGGSDLSLVTASDVKSFQQQYSVNHPILVDPKFSATIAYGAYSYPTIYVIDKKGVIQWQSYGEEPAATLAAAIQKAFKS